jgi:Domain of unknown function (DUF1918)
MPTAAPQAKPGDIITVPGHHVGEPARAGIVTAVLGEPGHLRYEVRWHDGHTSIFAPGGDAIIRRARRAAGTRKESK